jgi:hypothetical protein
MPKKLDFDLLFDIHHDASDRTRNRAREHWLRTVYAGVDQQFSLDGLAWIKLKTRNAR